MKEAEITRANVLIDARDTIKEFFSARTPDSDLVKQWTESEYEYQREEGARMPTRQVCGICIADTDDLNAEDRQEIVGWSIARDILERALAAELTRIEEELKTLGVTS